MNMDIQAALDIESIRPMPRIKTRTDAIIRCFNFLSTNIITNANGTVMASNPPAAFTLAINPPDRKYVPFAKSKKIKPLWAKSIKMPKLTTDAIINKIRRRTLIDSYDIRVE